MSITQTHTDLAATFARWTQPDLFGHRPSDPEIEAARQRFHRRMARRRRREAALRYLAEPWRAWCEATDAARLARRFLARFPERDRPDPAYDLLTDRQAAADYHWEEETAEAQNRRRGDEPEYGADYGGTDYGGVVSGGRGR